MLPLTILLVLLSLMILKGGEAGMTRLVLTRAVKADMALDPTVVTAHSFADVKFDLQIFPLLVDALSDDWESAQ